MQRLSNFFRHICLGAALALVLLAQAQAEPTIAPAAFQFHCRGLAAVLGRTNFPTLNKISTLKIAKPATDVVLKKFAHMVAGQLKFGTNVPSPVLLQPLLRDMATLETYGDAAEPGSGPLHFLLALPLTDAQDKNWREAFGHLRAVAPVNATIANTGGLRWGEGADAISLVRLKGWSVVACGTEFQNQEADYLQQIVAHGRPSPEFSSSNLWLESDLDSRFAAGWLPIAKRLKPARIHLAISAQNDTLQITANAVFSEAIPWHISAIKIPPMVHQPLTSFTAGRDVGAYLRLEPALGAMPASPLTNDFCAWALNTMPLQTYAAWPVENVSNVFAAIAPQWMDAFNPIFDKFNHTKLHRRDDPTRLVLLDLRVLSPMVEPVKTPAGDYMMISMFPLPPVGQAMPDSLVKQVEGPTNLVYYDWELTGDRVQQWRLLGSILSSGSTLLSDDAYDAHMALDKWVGDAHALLGNTVTEVRRTAPNELSFERTGPIGLTGIELFLLSNWLSDSTAVTRAAAAH